MILACPNDKHALTPRTVPIHKLEEKKQSLTTIAMEIIQLREEATPQAGLRVHRSHDQTGRVVCDSLQVGRYPAYSLFANYMPLVPRKVIDESTCEIP
jgi:hypothetical protein